jgi:hypothetical protein
VPAMGKWDADEDVDPEARVARRAPVQAIGPSEVFAMFQEGSPKAFMVSDPPLRVDPPFHAAGCAYLVDQGC